MDTNTSSHSPKESLEAVPPMSVQIGQSAAMAVDELVQYCLRLKPDLAARRSDSSLCVTPLIERLIVDGRLVQLRLAEDNRHNALMVRVSSLGQRSQPKNLLGESSDPSLTRPAAKKDKGYSEEEQLNRGIRFLAARGIAFRVYSDAGVTGEFPHNDQALIERLLEKKAARYKRIFEQVLLDDISKERRTPEEIAAISQYLEQRVAAIRARTTPPLNERELYSDGHDTDASSIIGPAPARGARRGRRRQEGKAYFRQALTQLWADVKADRIHTLAASDRSRIVRDADLESALFELLLKHDVRLVGTIEDLSHVDVSDPLQKGIAFFTGSVNEWQLYNISLNCFRGKVQAVESGKALGILPWWAERDENGIARLVPGCDALVRRIIGLYLQGYGHTSITTRLKAEGVTVGGKALTQNQVKAATSKDSVTGYKTYFGLRCRVLPIVVDDPDLLAELRAKRAERRDEFGYIYESAQWAEKLFTCLLRCSCGRAMIWHPATKDSGPLAAEGYYLCNAPNKKLNGVIHARVNELQLGEFVGELLGRNVHLLTGMLAQSLNKNSGADRGVRRAMLEAALATKAAELRALGEEARERAINSAAGLGIGPDHANFEEVVATLARATLEPHTRAMDALRVELAQLQIEANRDRRNEAVAAALEKVGGWDDLDTATRNRLLRSIFETIMIYPWRRENCVEFYLKGIETPLKRVYVRRGAHMTVEFPSVAEWVAQLAEMDAPGGCPVVKPLVTAKRRKSFYSYVYQRRIEDPDANAVAAAIRITSEQYPRMSPTREYLERYLRKHGTDEVTMQAFGRLWAEYEAEEYSRLQAKEAAARNLLGSA